MTYRCLLQMVLLLCLSTTALSRSYSLLRFQQGRSTAVCQKLLQQLPATPQHCLEARMDFQVPEEMKQAQQFRKEDAVLVMYEMLQQIFNILTRDFSSTGWSDAIIEHLREELYGQMSRLEPIQKEIMQKQTSTMGDTTDLHLRKYYFTLGQYLKSKEHNRTLSQRPIANILIASAVLQKPQGLRLLRANTDSFIVISGSSFVRNAVRRSHRPRSQLPCGAEMHSVRNAFPSCHRNALLATNEFSFVCDVLTRSHRP
ncbi:hypothetical protein R6Z07F_002579 [Ovis aries]|uniref:Antiluteolysin n=1 Tax=Ovis aries TaxID=9940 RepID=A0A836D6N9_SHEEP|nr:hypothetical protein JEQ12_009241 [Ovis aries]